MSKALRINCKGSQNINEMKMANVTETPEVKLEEYTLMSALERIVVASYDSGLVEEMMVHAAVALEYVTSKTGLNKIEALLFAICVDHSYDPSINMMDLREWIECPMITLMKYQQDMDALVEKGFLMPGAEANGLKCYAVPEHIIEMLNQNDLTVKDTTSNLSIDNFFDKMGEYFKLRRQGWSYQVLSKHIETLVSKNMHLTYCQKIKELTELEAKDIMVLHYFCHRLVNHNDSSIDEDKLSGILENRKATADVIRAFDDETHPLNDLELVELKSEDGLVGDDIYVLTNKARESLLVEADVELYEEPQVICHNELIESTDITYKKMFFSKDVLFQLSRLASLLVVDKYDEICKRLEEQGMRKGFACLFYGAPGTGKTETALQLARQTGRDIMQVDISEMRSKWVGESQKLVKGLFERYRKAVKKSSVAPILLFNEADALLTRRNASVEGSVDKMENSMQNIFLQEIENLEGILIATTNLTTNLDPAFERRFLYKIEFKMPNVDCRKNMWKTMIKDLSDVDAKALAEKYKFSGGQIENVSRKKIVDTILLGADAVTTDSLYKYCDAELISNAAHKTVGFYKN